MRGGSASVPRVALQLGRLQDQAGIGSALPVALSLGSLLGTRLACRAPSRPGHAALAPVRAASPPAVRACTAARHRALFAPEVSASWPQLWAGPSKNS